MQCEASCQCSQVQKESASSARHLRRSLKAADEEVEVVRLIARKSHPAGSFVLKRDGMTYICYDHRKEESTRTDVRIRNVRPSMRFSTSVPALRSRPRPRPPGCSLLTVAAKIPNVSMSATAHVMTVGVERIDGVDWWALACLAALDLKRLARRLSPPNCDVLGKMV